MDDILLASISRWMRRMFAFLDREGVVVRESKEPRSTAEAIAGRLAKSAELSADRGRARRLGAHPVFTGWSQRMVRPWSAVESRQAYQALKSLAIHKTDRNDARGLAHLAQPHWLLQARACEVASRARRPLVNQRAQKLVGPASDLGKSDPWSRGRVRGPTAPARITAAFIDNALPEQAEGIAGLSVAMRGLIAARTAVMTAVAAIDADIRRMTRASAACLPADDDSRERRPN